MVGDLEMSVSAYSVFPIFIFLLSFTNSDVLLKLLFIFVELIRVPIDNFRFTFWEFFAAFWSGQKVFFLQRITSFLSYASKTNHSSTQLIRARVITTNKSLLYQF